MGSSVSRAARAVEEAGGANINCYHTSAGRAKATYNIDLTKSLRHKTSIGRSVAPRAPPQAQPVEGVDLPAEEMWR